MDETPRAKFDEVHRRYQDKIFRLIVEQVGVRDIAEDLTVETFCNAYRAFSRLRPEVDIEEWLKAIALNNCQNRFNQLWRDSGAKPEAE